MKAITTRSGVAYEGPSIPTSKKVVEQETDETADKEQLNFQGSNAHIQPPVIPIPEPDVLNTLPRPNLPYPSRHNDQKLHEKATNQMDKFFQISQDLHFDLSFADALLLMPKFASTIKSLLTNKDKLFEKKISLPELTPTQMTLELADRSITRPKGVAEDVFVKVGEEITLRVNDEAVTFNLNQTTRYSSTYDDLLVNRIDIIDVAREEYAQEILDFKEVIKAKSSFKEPPKVELKDLPSHLEYAYLEKNDKLPVIILKDLKDEEKEAVLNVLKSHKRAIAWKITDINGIDPRFCTHIILMEEDFKPSVQSQRSVNPKIHEVIKKEVLKLLDAGMIYLISDNP
uniref:Reverse transcriptase domain-containing protein n=1 Tax=Tanacetum cinerariifolium TaxID=118510 RepID=A0A699KEB9_TANCI|nr:hypothetical protein [Tanacetum cinerariifolium]